MQNRTVWFFGNSVQRGYFFAAQALLGGVADTSVEEQKRRCGRGGIYLAEREEQGSCFGLCTCADRVAPGLDLSFVWQQRVFDGRVRDALLGKSADRSTNVARGDIVFLNAGMDDILSWFGILAQKQTVMKQVSTVSTVSTGSSLGSEFLRRSRPC